MNPIVLTIGSLSVGFLLLWSWLFVRCCRKRKYLRALNHFVLLLLCLCIAIIAFGLQASVYGYEALTREVQAARLDVQPRTKQQFEAVLTLPSGDQKRYLLAGDELYIDARILKWHGYVNLLGLHTQYELDRIGGRYRDIADERARPRTLYQLSGDRFLDAYVLRNRFDGLSPLVDAKYGSASFVPADKPRSFDLMVSTTGLLLRPAADLR